MTVVNQVLVCCLYFSQFPLFKQLKWRNSCVPFLFPCSALLLGSKSQISIVHMINSIFFFLDFEFSRCLKNQTYVNKVGYISEFLFGIFDELEKRLFIKKLLKWANKKCKNFNIQNVVFLKKIIMKNTYIYHYFRPLCQKS